jgi:hypothetical protein
MQTGPDQQSLDFYRHVMNQLQTAQIPFLVGGAYAFATYTGIERHTKDFDIFVRPGDVQRILSLFTDQGYKTELTFPHWIGKIHDASGAFVDLIYSSGNGIASVDDEWFSNALSRDVFGITVNVCPAEEIIWSKSFVMERERFDGADIAHLLLAYGDKLNWERVLRRFGMYWHILFAHLTLFCFIYPHMRQKIPAQVIQELCRRMAEETSAAPPTEPVCNGTLISRSQYLTDIGQWGFHDARLQPRGKMTAEDIAYWTSAIVRDGSL